MTPSKVKKETSEQRKYPIGTILAVDLYANGNFFEAVLKNYRTEKRGNDGNWAFMEYLDDKDSKGWVDLNAIRVVELLEENILTLEDCDGKDVTEDEKGFLNRRLTVLWMDDSRYSGTITKTFKNNKTFVFISYDNGDKCWYNLSSEKQEQSKMEDTESVANSQGSRQSTTKSSKSIKEEAIKEQEESVMEKEAISKKHEIAKRELQKKYPIGCTISVDIYHDGHYHDATVKKFLGNANKRQQAKGEQWIYIQFLDHSKMKQWIDLSCIKAIKMTPEKTLRLDELEPGDDRGFLGKRIIVEWPDGNKYRGLATRSAIDNKHFVFVEYDDGDECWCDLQLESEWGIDDEEAVEVDNDYDSESDDESVEAGKSRPKSKRKKNAEASDKSIKKAKAGEEEYDF